MNEHKIKVIANESFSVQPDWQELMLFVKLLNQTWEQDADDWYEKTLWRNGNERTD